MTLVQYFDNYVVTVLNLFLFDLFQKIDQLVCLLPEFSYMTGLTDAMRNDHRVMKDIAMYTRITPNQRQAALKKFIDNVNGKCIWMETFF